MGEQQAGHVRSALRRRRSSKLIRTLIVFEAIAAVITGASVVGVVGSNRTASADEYNPASLLHNFTVVVSGDADLQHGSSGGEIEGSLAAGGNVSFGTYDLAPPTQPGMTLPAVDGDQVQLFVGGTVAIDAGSSKLDVNAGRARVTDTTGMQVSADRRLYRDDQSRYLLNQSSSPQSTVGNPSSSSDYTATPGAFTGTFSGAFSQLRSISTALHDLSAADGAAMVTPVNDGGKWAITLVSGTVNVLNTDTATLAGVSEVNFQGGVLPSATTPLIVNVSSSTGTTLHTPRINGGVAHNAQYVLWNFSGWSTLTLASGGGEMSGGVLAPDADLLFARTVLFEGQIVAKSVVIRGSAEIHHWGFLSQVRTTPTPTPTPTPSPTAAAGDVTFSNETCEALGAWKYVVGVGSHVHYTLTVGGVTTAVLPGAHIPDRIGVEYLITAVPDDGYLLEGTTQWRYTFSNADGCLPTHPLAYGLVEATHASCAGDTNSYNAAAVDGIEYRQTLGGVTTPLAPGIHTPTRLGVTYTITAIAVDPYGLDPGYPASWSFVFTSAGACDLPTLSQTGISPWWIPLSAGGLAMIVLGIVIVVVVRRRREGSESA